MFRVIAAFSVIAVGVAAQDSIWQGNRFSSDLHEISPCGEVVNRIDLTSNGFNLRSAHKAPDGKIWVVNFITPTFTIINPDGTGLMNVTYGLGSPYAIAFDAAGNAWIAGGTGVEQYDPNGTLLVSVPLPLGAPLGVTIDVFGTVWVAHRLNPNPSLSRIVPGAVPTVTTHLVQGPMGGTTRMQPVSVVADQRGLGTDSHIWTIGDGSGEIAEFDAAGNWLNTYLVAVGGNLTGLTVGPTGNLWCGDFRNGNIYEIDSLTGMVVNTFMSPPNVLGLEFDSFGRMWSTSRVSFSGPVPSEVRRIDTATGALEVPALVGAGAGSNASSGWHHALVVNANGDPDLDGIPSILEIQNGTSPYDAQSNSNVHLLVGGNTMIGSATADLTITMSDPLAVANIVLANDVVAPGSGVTVPGISGEVRLDVGTLIMPPLFFLSITGSAAIPIALPNDPLLIGQTIHTQAFVTSASGASFSNATCLMFY